MSDRMIREIETSFRSEYERLRERLKRLGLNHMASDSLGLQMDRRVTLSIDVSAIDFHALLAAAEQKQLLPTIVLQTALRNTFPDAYRQGIRDLLVGLEAPADVVEILQRQGIAYKTMDRQVFKELVTKRIGELSR